MHYYILLLKNYGGRLRIYHDGGQAVLPLRYALDDVGNIVKTTQDDGTVWEYTYDNRYRLIAAVREGEQGRVLHYSPYYIIGASNWDMRTIHIEGNKCLKCHRIGMKTVEELMGDRWHPNDRMPPKNPGNLSEHFQALLDCRKNGPGNTPGCDWIILPAGDSLGQSARDDYPHRARFNEPASMAYN